MTREELFKQIEALGCFEAWNHTGLKTAYIKDPDAVIVAWVSNSATHLLGTSEILESYPEDIRKALLDILVEYAKTPIEERSQKSYRIRFSSDCGVAKDSEYLNHNGVWVFFDDREDNKDKQTVFTEKEIEKLEKEYPWIAKMLERKELVKEHVAL